MDRALGQEIKQYNQDHTALLPGWKSQDSRPTAAHGECLAICHTRLLPFPIAAGCGANQFFGEQLLSLPSHHGPYQFYLRSRQDDVQVLKETTGFLKYGINSNKHLCRGKWMEYLRTHRCVCRGEAGYLLWDWKSPSEGAPITTASKHRVPRVTEAYLNWILRQSHGPDAHLRRRDLLNKQQHVRCVKSDSKHWQVLPYLEYYRILLCRHCRQGSHFLTRRQFIKHTQHNPGFV